MDNFSALESLILRYFNPRGNENLVLQPYCYVVEMALEGGATGTDQFQIAANANFVLTNPRFHCVDGDGESVQSPNIGIQLQDTGSQQLFSSNFVPISTYFGQPEYANDAGILCYPRVIAARSGLGIQAVNNSEDTALLRLAFHGIQIYGLSPR